jgi:hypothetical protein
MARAGDAAGIYDVSALAHAVQAVTGVYRSIPFQYPPTYLLILAPLSLLPMGVAFAAVEGLGALAALAAARVAGARRAGLAAVLASPALGASVLFGQNGAWTGALLVGGLSMIQARPIVAGAMLGLLVAKPQAALLVPVCLVAGRAWRALAAFLLGAGSIALVSLLAFGARAWVELADKVPPLAQLVTLTIRARRVGNLSLAPMDVACWWGLSLHVAEALQACTSMACALLAWHAWRRTDVGPAARLAATACLAVLAAGHAMLYDLVGVSAALAATVAERRPGFLQALAMAAAWSWPSLAEPLQERGFPQVAPLLVAWAASACWFQMQVAAVGEPSSPGRSIVASDRQEHALHLPGGPRSTRR